MAAAGYFITAADKTYMGWRQMAIGMATGIACYYYNRFSFIVAEYSITAASRSRYCVGSRRRFGWQGDGFTWLGGRATKMVKVKGIGRFLVTAARIIGMATAILIAYV
jgi:hypothetical protein